MNHVLAIDPGKNGAAALLSWGRPANFVVKIYDLASDDKALRTDIRTFAGNIVAAWVEGDFEGGLGKGDEKINWVSLMKVSQNAGEWWGFLLAHGVKVEYVTPRKWQKRYRTTRTGKAKAHVRRFIESNRQYLELCTGPRDGYLKDRADALAMAIYLKDILAEEG